MAKRQIIDAHHHLWDVSAGYNYPWLQDRPFGDGLLGNIAPIAEPNYLLADYRADTAGYDVVGSIHIEAVPADAAKEIRWLEDIAAHDMLPSVFVARVELQRPDAELAIAAHAASPHVRGIRHNINWHSNPKYSFTSHDFLVDTAWLEGFKLLRKYELSFDLQLYPRQMDEACALAADNPDTQIILNHAGMPVDRDPESIEVWRARIKRLATFDNVAAKISGLGMVDHHWTTESIRPFVRHVIDCFGTGRSMFGSNFPVDKLYSSFATLYGAFEEIVADLTVEEQDKVFRANARTFYRL